MKLHISNKDLALLSAGLVEGQKKEKILSHLELCERCRDSYGKISSIFAPLYKNSIPSNMLEQRVIRSFREITASEKVKTRGLLWKFAAAMAAVVIVSASAMYMSMPDEKIVEMDLAALSITGKSEINGKALATPVSVSSGTRIVSDNGALAEVGLDSVFTVRIVDSADLLIEKAVKKGDEYEFRFTLSAGKVIADFNENVKMKYSFTTPDSLIESIGTSFMIDSAPGKTVLSVKTGKLWITKSSATGRSLAVEGNRYLIDKDRDIRIEKAEKRDFDIHSRNAAMNTGRVAAVQKFADIDKKTEPSGKSDDNADKKSIDKDTKKDLKDIRKEMRERRKAEKRDRKDRK